MNLSITTACRFLGISRQAYYQRIERQQWRMRHEQEVLTFVQTERLYQPRIGTRKLQHLMSIARLHIGRDHLFSLLREHRLLVPNKHAYHRTTQSHHRFHCHPNIIKSGIELTRPEQLWVADITYLPTHDGEA
ncbi:IS3 family transposase, partial [Endozoicomonas sp. G2_1]|nr:IS3 family transposase [Endozoicomonas sp. G2_1]